MNSVTVPSLVLRRTYGAPPKRVYEAWTNPDLARQFLCPEGMTIPEVRMDVRVGGAFRLVMQKSDGEQFIAYGVYREVQPARKLSMTWRWEESSPAEEHETLLTVEFAPHENGTELILTHEQLSSVESRGNHEHGWTQILDKLAEL